MAEHQGRPAGPAHGPRGTSQRGAAWAPLFLILAGLSYVAMGALVRYIAESERLHPFQIAFLRNVMVLLPMLCLLRPLGISLLPSRHKEAWVPGRLRTGGHAVLVRGREPPAARGLHAYRLLAVLIAALVARVGLKEPLGFDRLLAILAGLAGALVIVRPSPAGISAGAAAALLSALMDALARYDAAAREDRASIRPSLTFSSSPRPSLGVAAAFTWTLPSGHALLLAGLAAAAGTTGQYFVARTYRHADVAALAPLEFLQIPSRRRSASRP